MFQNIINNAVDIKDFYFISDKVEAVTAGLPNAYQAVWCVHTGTRTSEVSRIRHKNILSNYLNVIKKNITEFFSRRDKNKLAKVIFRRGRC